MRHDQEEEEMSTTTTLRVVIATPLEPELCELLVEREPRLEVVVDQDLLPPMRWPGDHEGDPSFTRTPEQQAAYDALVDSADALYGIPDSAPSTLARTVAANPRLRWVHTMAAGGGGQVKAAGLSQPDLERIAFSTSAGPHSGPLAEFAVFGVLAGAKDLPRLQALKAERTWANRWAMRQVYEMTVVVVGLGSIGQGIATRFTALGARVIGVNRSVKDVDVAELFTTDRLVEACAGADAIVLALPGTAATEGLVGAEALDAAAPGVIVVNVGRGSSLDEEALISRLRNGQVGFAALDVTAVEPLAAGSPLWGLDNVVLAPHTAALNAGEDRAIAEMFAENARRLLDGEPLVNAVDIVEFY